MRPPRRSTWLELLRESYDIPDVVNDRNVEAAVAARLAASRIPATPAKSEEVPPVTADADADIALHDLAGTVVRITRRLGMQGSWTGFSWWLVTLRQMSDDSLTGSSP